MKANQYPTINSLIRKLIGGLKEECHVADIQLQIKYAQLKSERNLAFIKFQNQSYNSILILNDMPNFKQHKIHADATQKQYKCVISNCRKLKLVQKQKNIIKLNIKLGNEKIEKVIDKENWIACSKVQKINRQFNLLVDKKQFRLDLNISEMVSQNAEMILKKFDRKLIPAIRAMRFIDSIILKISPYYYIKASQIYQTQDITEKQQFFKVFQKQNTQQTDKYILNKIPKNSKVHPKFQIQLIMVEEGIHKILKLIKQQQQLNMFIGDIINDFKNLSNPQYEIKQDIQQLMSGLKL